MTGKEKVFVLSEISNPLYTVVSASVLVHCLALIKFYVFYISQSFVISSLSFGILSLIMFCSCHYMPCLYMPHMWAENS